MKYFIISDNFMVLRIPIWQIDDGVRAAGLEGNKDLLYNETEALRNDQN